MTALIRAVGSASIPCVPGQPLPNDRIDSTIVIASVVINDSETPARFMVLLLNPGPPFYTVADIDAEGTVSCRTDHMNIVPAVEQYINKGGDY